MWGIIAGQIACFAIFLGASAYAATIRHGYELIIIAADSLLMSGISIILAVCTLGRVHELDSF
jgi:hypothetical protein